MTSLKKQCFRDQAKRTARGYRASQWRRTLDRIAASSDQVRTDGVGPVGLGMMARRIEDGGADADGGLGEAEMAVLEGGKLDLAGLGGAQGGRRVE